MPVRLNPYLNFRGRAREALDFYHGVFGGELVTSTFAEGGMGEDPAEQDLIMHGMLTGSSGLVLMGSDTPERMGYTKGENEFSVSLSGEADADAELTGYWQGLSDGATIREPLVEAPWGAKFGMLTDRFGVNWLVNIG